MNIFTLGEHVLHPKTREVKVVVAVDHANGTVVLADNYVKFTGMSTHKDTEIAFRKHGKA